MSKPFVCNRIGGGYAGLDIEIIEAMASELNFTVIYVRAQDLKTERDVDTIPWRNNYGLWKVLHLRAISGDVDITLGALAI